MPSARERPLFERLLMACVALLFLLQPLALAASSCSLRAKLGGKSCCCAAMQRDGAAPMSCCAKSAQDAPAKAPAKKGCDCEVSAPPLLPPSTPELPSFLGELARAPEFPSAFTLQTELAPTRLRAHAPPGFASCFHALLGAGMGRALAFESKLLS
ncbi:MAG: hypothetical protein IPJ19_21405 [Planctomycetes bacterium]|nr:hypothetical protein [Planctomycetota bacterium]